MLANSLSNNPGAYRKIIDILHSHGILIHEMYKGMAMQDNWSSMGKKNQVREFLSWLKEANTTRRYLEFYAALMGCGLQSELKTLQSHKKFKAAEKTQVNTCTGMQTFITWAN